MIPTPRKDRTIVVNFASKSKYNEIVENRSWFRSYLEQSYFLTPEIFPPFFEDGFRFHGTICSKKQQLCTRRILLKATGEVYQIRPSFVLPYMTAMTDKISDILLLRLWSVPFWMLARLGGRDHMFWWRIYVSLGRFSLVGTTVKKPEKWPAHPLADEKHTRWKKQKVFVPTTVANNCFLGAAVTKSASEDDLAEGYGVFRDEAVAIDPHYRPKTVTTDGWEALQNAWRRLFDGIVVILCFLHSWLKIKRRCKRDNGLLQKIGEKVWHVYRSERVAVFSQRIRRLKEWAVVTVKIENVRKQIEKLCNKSEELKRAYKYEGAPRTSNGLDRLMDYQDRQLYSMRYLRGSEETIQLAVRSMALLWNFHPYDGGAGFSPFAHLNGMYYHDDWLQNMMIAASLQRKTTSHKKRYD